MGKDDVRSVGRSKLVPFIQGESAAARHERRKAENLRMSRALESWCRASGISFKISNEGHHWRFRKEGLFAEWWPSSAKLVRQGDYDRGIHVHDVNQAMKILSAFFKSRTTRTVIACEICGKTLEQPLEVGLVAHEGTAPIGVCFDCGQRRINS